MLYYADPLEKETRKGFWLALVDLGLIVVMC